MGPEIKKKIAGETDNPTSPPAAVKRETTI